MTFKPGEKTPKYGSFLLVYAVLWPHGGKFDNLKKKTRLYCWEPQQPQVGVERVKKAFDSLEDARAFAAQRGYDGIRVRIGE